MATTDGLSEILGELRAGGEVDSQGQFTLDRAQARAKMQKFQLADARRYVLELVQAAVLRGATAIAFEIDADDMRMRFDGLVFTAAELEDLWGSIFADGDDRRLRGVRQLALGLNAALGLDPKQIVVRSGDQQLSLVPGREDALVTTEPAIAGTTIHVAQRLRLGLVMAFFRNLGGRLGEEIHLRERCGHAPIAITLDGKSIIRGMHIEGAIVEKPIAGAGVRGVVGLTGSPQAAEMRLLKDGVWIDSQPLRDCGLGIVAVIEGEKLRKDVSMAKIVADEALAEIEGLLRVERWGLFAALAAKDPQALLRVREEVLTFLKLRDVRKRPAGRAVAELVMWTDARTCTDLGRSLRTISLAELVDAVRDTANEEGARGLQCATIDREYPVLFAEGPPIPRVDADEVARLKRLLACTVTPIDAELEQANRRELARRAWQARTMVPRVPAWRGGLRRGVIGGPGIDGGLAIHIDAASAAPRRAGTIWLIAEGCLLAEWAVAWGLGAVDVAVEAAFEPSEMFDDVVRDRTVVEVFLRTLSGLLSPLAELAVSTRGTAIEAEIRGLVKAWLLLVLDDEERDGLWERLAVPKPLRPAEAAVRAIVPGASLLFAGGETMEGLLQLPLFEDFDGTRRSMRELKTRLARVGRLDEVDRGTATEPGLGNEVLWLGRGDRKIVRSLFGERALCSWAGTLADLRRERRFRARPVQTIAARERALRAELTATGRDPKLWCHSLAVGEIEAVLTLTPRAEERGDPGAQIDLLVEGRTICTRGFDLGFGMIVGAAMSTGLRPAASWDDVVADEELAAVEAALRAGAWALVAAQVRNGRSWMAPELKWLRSQLLLRLAIRAREEVLAAAPALTRAPLFATLDRGTLSLEEVDALIAANGQIAWVPGSTPGAALRDPPIVCEEPRAIEALRGWCGAEQVVDGGPRLSAYRRERQFGDLPRIAEIKLEPANVWSTVPVTGGTPKLEGEIGLSRVRKEGGLRLVLCSEGRRLGEFMHADVPAPVEAILADEAVALNDDGLVDTGSKRYTQCVRRCRRAVSGMITTLCERFAGLPAEERAAARGLLLDYAAAMQGRGSGTNKGSEAVRGVRLFVDVWGEAHSLAEVEARARSRGAIEVVTREVEAPDAGVKLERLILVVDGPAQRCLAGTLRVINLDSSWAQELAGMRALASAPRCELPALHEVAWVDRKATIAGGLQVHLWIPRQPNAGDVAVRLAQAGREVGRVVAIAGVPCAGIATGAATVANGEVILEKRQRSSLAKQVCVLYEALAKQVQNGRLKRSEREGALELLRQVDTALGVGGDPLLAEMGKPLERLQELLAGLIPPALRGARVAAKVEPVVAKKTAAAEAAPVAVEATPEQRLLLAVRAELEWVRERHGTLLERVKLDRLAIGTGAEGGICRFDKGIVLQQRHPLVARLLRQLAEGRGPDPIDLAFVTTNVYTVMNAVAEGIDAEDEQAFVAKLAAGLASGLGRG